MLEWIGLAGLKSSRAELTLRIDRVAGDRVAGDRGVGGRVTRPAACQEYPLILMIQGFWPGAGKTREFSV